MSEHLRRHFRNAGEPGSVQPMALSVIAPAYVSGMGFSGWRQSEDFLTGEFFGLLRYLPMRMGVLPVLARARTTKDLTFARWLQDHGLVDHHEIKLWPEFGRHIPDVLVHLNDRGDLPIADVIVEVKLYSGESGRSDDPRHQLARYMAALATDSTLCRASARSVVYLTLDRTMPKGELDVALGDAGQAREKVQLFWVGWHQVAASLHDLVSGASLKAFARHEARIIQDLRGILKARGIRTDAELEHFPLEGIEPLRDIDAWLKSWPSASRSVP